MTHKLLTDSRLFSFVERIDRDAVTRVAAAPCPHCGGRLDRADFPRKPRGLPAGVGKIYERRPSLCCRTDGCRRRQTPRLVGLLSRRVYASVVVVLIAALCQGPSPTRMSALREAVGASPRTVRRWLVWWREVFPASDAWRRLQAALVPPPNGPLPAAALTRLAPCDDDGFGGVVLLLRHLAS